MKTVYISYLDEINPAKVRAFMGACSQLLRINNQPTDRFYILFGSVGGDVDAGIALYNFLRALPVKITFRNTSAVNSIGNVVFMAGDERFATQHATFLMHGTTHGLNGNFDREALGQINSLAVQAENKIVHVISQRTKLTETEIRALFTQGQSKDTVFALEKGFIQEVRDPIIPANETLVTFNFP